MSRMLPVQRGNRNRSAFKQHFMGLEEAILFARQRLHDFNLHVVTLPVFLKRAHGDTMPAVPMGELGVQKNDTFFVALNNSQSRHHGTRVESPIQKVKEIIEMHPYIDSEYTYN